MGNCNIKDTGFDPTIKISKTHFQFNYVIGKGAYGSVKGPPQKN